MLFSYLELCVLEYVFCLWCPLVHAPNEGDVYPRQGCLYCRACFFLDAVGNLLEFFFYLFQKLVELTEGVHDVWYNG